MTGMFKPKQKVTLALLSATMYLSLTESRWRESSLLLT